MSPLGCCRRLGRDAPGRSRGTPRRRAPRGQSAQLACGASLNNTSRSRAKFLISGSAAPPIARASAPIDAGDDLDVGQAAPVERLDVARRRGGRASANRDRHRAVDDDRRDVDDRDRGDRGVGERERGLLDPASRSGPKSSQASGVRQIDEGSRPPLRAAARAGRSRRGRSIAKSRRRRSRARRSASSRARAALPVRPM